MTLIVPIAFVADKLVFATDKRVVVAGQVDDTFNKLICLGNTAVGSACGAPRCLAPGTFAVQFDAFQLLQAFFANRAVDQQGIDDFGQHLVAQHANFIQTHRNSTPLNYTGYLFTVPIFYVNAGRIVKNVVVVSYSPQNGATFQRLSILMKNSKPCLFGDTQVRNALDAGHPVFNALWAIQGMSNLVRTNLAFATITQQQAVDAAREIISHASAQAATITNGVTISAACDVVVLDSNGITVV